MTQRYEDIIVESKLDIPYRYYAGSVVSRFYDALENERRILGIRCGSCKRVFMPPRATCGKCFKEMNEWVELKDEGKVVNYTVIHYEDAIHPVKAPFAYGLIKLDGADTAFVHLLGEVDLSKNLKWIRVKAVFSEEKTGNILNIKYFKPV